MTSLEELLVAQQGLYRMEFSLPGRSLTAKRRYEVDVRVLAPVVTGEVLLKSGWVPLRGYIVQRERRRNPYADHDWVKGRFVFTVGSSRQEVRIEFDSSFNGSPQNVLTSFAEAVSPYRSDDLPRHLARVVQDAGRGLDHVREVCAELAGHDDPESRLAYAEALLAQARLLLLLDQGAAAARVGEEGAGAARESGLPPGARMATSGRDLAWALDLRGRAAAAARVTDGLSAAAEGGGAGPAAGGAPEPGSTGEKRRTEGEEVE
ncbi:hypothetical protein [Streptomyces sp. NPDC058653]|uniref:hypothetical protein n=1 Tax=Streptomyces sp. NPDC058653 TaxID=3346576 RepID=UPI0036581226